MGGRERERVGRRDGERERERERGACIYTHVCVHICTKILYLHLYFIRKWLIQEGMHVSVYGVATIRGPLKIIGLFCKRAI